MDIVQVIEKLLALVERYGVAVAFAGYCAYEVQIMRQQMIETEAAYSKQLELINKQLSELIKEYTNMVRDYTKVAADLTNQVHELNNVIQRIIFAVEGQYKRGGSDD